MATKAMRFKTVCVMAALAVATVLMLAPQSAWAQGNVAKIGSTEYPTVAAAVGAAQSGDTIELLQNATSGPITIPADMQVTFDLGGNVLTMRNAFSPVNVHGENHYVYIVNNGDLAIENGSVAIPSVGDEGILNRGQLTIADNAAVSCSGSVHTNSPQNYIILNDNGTVNTAGALTSAKNNGIVTFGGAVNVTGGSISATAQNCAAIDIFSSDYTSSGAGADVTISGGMIASDLVAASTNNVKSADSSLTITGGTISTRTTSIYWPSSGTLTIGDADTGEGPVIESAIGSAVEICSGTFNVYGGSLSGGLQQTESDGLSTEDLQQIFTTVGTSGYGSIGDAVTVFADRPGYTGNPLTVDISGGTFTSAQNYGIRIFDNNAFEGAAAGDQEVVLSISDGSFTGALGGADVAYLQDANKNLISGGAFPEKPDADSIAPLYVAVQNPDGTWSVAMHEHSAADGAAWEQDASSHWHVCSFEGCVQTLDEAPHAFVWIVDQEPTTSSEGSRHQECSVCGYALASETIEKLPSQAADGETGPQSETPGGSSGSGTLPTTGDAAPVALLAWTVLVAAVVAGVAALRARRC